MQAESWAEKRQAHLVQFGTREATPAKRVPTVAEFSKRFLAEYCEAERQKPSSISAKKTILKKYILPDLGPRRLDEVTTEDVQAIKVALQSKSPKTINNTLSVLGRMLRVAIEWGVIDTLPCRLKPLRYRPPEMEFYGFEQFADLVEAAGELDDRIKAAVLLAGDAGLRRGEIIGLEASDVDFKRGTINIQRSVWRGQVTAPKGGRSRRVPMTEELKKTLKALRHLQGPRMLYSDLGAPLTKEFLTDWMSKAQRKAGLKANGGIHILRHTFCSHLAMRGAPTMAIKELAGHADLSTTMRYMHLSPETKDGAIRLLDSRPAAGRGDQGETPPSEKPNSS